MFRCIIILVFILFGEITFADSPAHSRKFNATAKGNSK